MTSPNLAPVKFEVAHHFFFAQAQVLGHARIAHVLQRVAAGAIVHVQLGAVLQRGLVAETVARRKQGPALGGDRGEGNQQSAEEQGMRVVNLLVMRRHPFRHRLGLVDLGPQGHGDEESEVEEM